MAVCPAKPQGADALYPGNHYVTFQKERRRRIVRDALALLEPSFAGQVFDALGPQIADLHLRHPGLLDGGAVGAAIGGTGQGPEPMQIG